MFEEDSEGMDFDRPMGEMHDVVCAECGQETQVPFKPDGTRPVYCRDCYQKNTPSRGGRGGGGGGGRFPREMHDVVCAECGQSTQVPFKPDGTRPVYCRDCYQKNRPPRY